MSENEENMQKDSKEPWNDSFSGNQPEKTSRVAHRRKTQQVRVIIGVLIAAVVALSMVPVVGYLQTLNKPESQGTEIPKTMTSETKVTSFSADASKSAEKEAAKKAEADAQKAQAEADKAAKESKAAESNTKAKSESKDENKDQKTVAVEAGQGAYRVATNAGISVDELRTLNPGVNIDSLSAGQMLRVK